jgi:hypothetical protein
LTAAIKAKSGTNHIILITKRRIVQSQNWK